MSALRIGEVQNVVMAIVVSKISKRRNLDHSPILWLRSNPRLLSIRNN